MCSLSTCGTRLAAVPRSLSRTPTSKIPVQLSARFFSRNGRRVGPGGCPRSSGSREPELASRPQPLRRRVRSGSRVFTPRERTAVQQLKCDRLFTWPTDQPRHATEHFRYPVDTNSPPVFSAPARTIPLYLVDVPEPIAAVWRPNRIRKKTTI